MRRCDGRAHDAMRPLKLESWNEGYAEGACWIAYGRTQLLCTATVEEEVPRFLRGSRAGWITAEYGMLPRSTHQRMRREASMGRQSGRTQEIQRLIGRSLRSVMDAKALGERQITVDVDVLVADGGTRTAAITGAYLAVYRACQTLTKRGDCKSFPLYDSVSAISCGLVDGTVLVDLDYEEDSTAEVDGNFVITGSGRLVEVQTTAERGHFSSDHLMRMLMSATETCRILAQSQASFLKGLVE